MKKGFVLIITALVIIIDQVSKYLARAYLKEKPFTVIKGFFRLFYLENRGAVFGFWQGSYSILVPVTVIILTVGIWAVYAGKFKKPLELLSVSLILGGAVGNMIDRVFWGFVTDFLDFHGIWNYVFNIADSAVVVGGILLAVSVLFDFKNEKHRFLESQNEDI